MINTPMGAARPRDSEKCRNAPLAVSFQKVYPLTPTHELAQAICVEAPDRSSGKRIQHIRIKYGRTGFIPLNELMKRETA